MKYEATHTLKVIFDGKQKIKFTKGEVISQKKFDTLSEREAQYFIPVGLDEIINEVQGKTEDKNNDVNYDQYSNILDTSLINFMV